MKRLLAWPILIIFAFCTLFTGTLNAETNSSVYSSQVYINVNGQRIYPDEPAFIRNNRTLVPLRGIFEKMGAVVEWIADTRSIVVTLGSTVINLQIDSNTAFVNGVSKWMDVPPEIYSNRTMIPLRFISESLGMWVRWVPEARLATVTDPGYFNNLPSEMVLGYTTNDYPGDDGSYKSLVDYHNNLNAIATFSYSFDTNGNLKKIGESQKNTVTFANKNNIAPLLLVSNYNNDGFDINLAHAVLSSPVKRAALIRNILVAMSREEYVGVNIDIEYIYWYDRQNYTNFVKELKQELTQYGYLTTLSVIAKDKDYYVNDNWGGAYDYREIGKYADKLMFMTYDQHRPEGSPGPIASHSWVEGVLQYATAEMPADKIILGIPAYGYNWSGNGASTVLFKNVKSMIAKYGAQVQWDTESMSPHFSYMYNGILHNVWYENTESISSKLDLVKQYGLGGIAIWRLGFDNDDFWNTVNMKMRKSRELP